MLMLFQCWVSADAGLLWELPISFTHCQEKRNIAMQNKNCLEKKTLVGKNKNSLETPLGFPHQFHTLPETLPCKTKTLPGKNINIARRNKNNKWKNTIK